MTLMNTIPSSAFAGNDGIDDFSHLSHCRSLQVTAGHTFRPLGSNTGGTATNPQIRLITYIKTIT